MKRLRGDWVSDARRADRSLSIYEWADVADHLIDQLIDEGSGAMKAVQQLPARHQQRALDLLDKATATIRAHGGTSFNVDSETYTPSPEEPRTEWDPEQREAIDQIGGAISQAAGTYETAKAQDPRIETSIDLIRVAPDSGMLQAALGFVKSMDALYPLGQFRIAWVTATHNALIRLSAHQYRSPDEAKSAVNQLTRAYGKHELGLAMSPTIWAMSADRDQVVKMFETLGAELGIRESSPSESYTTVRRIFELEDLRQGGSISDEEFRLLKKEALELWEGNKG